MLKLLLARTGKDACQNGKTMVGAGAIEEVDLGSHGSSLGIVGSVDQKAQAAEQNSPCTHRTGL
jgi:hypothetical protein